MHEFALLDTLAALITGLHIAIAPNIGSIDFAAFLKKSRRDFNSSFLLIIVVFFINKTNKSIYSLNLFLRFYWTYAMTSATRIIFYFRYVTRCAIEQKLSLCRVI